MLCIKTLIFSGLYTRRGCIAVNFAGVLVFDAQAPPPPPPPPLFGKRSELYDSAEFS